MKARCLFFSARYLRDKTVMEPVNENCCCYPRLPVDPPKHKQRVFVLTFESTQVQGTVQHHGLHHSPLLHLRSGEEIPGPLRP